MSRILKTASHDISRGFLIGFIALLIVIPGAILFVVLLYQNNLGALSDTFLILASVLWMAVFLGGMLLFIITTSRRHKKWLDAVFTPLGLTGRRYLINWWEYNGTLAGRQLTARFYKGPTLDLILSTPLKTRFAVSTPTELGSAVAQKLNEPPMILGVPGLSGINASALDEDWFNRLLASAELTDCLSRLLKAGENWALIQQVILAPGQLRLTLYRNKNLFNYDFTADEVSSWVEDLLTILQIAENAPAPQFTAEVTNLEKAARSGSLNRRALLIILAFFVVFGTCFGLTLWFLVKFGG